MRRCTRAPRRTIRLTSLSGVANRYVALTPGGEVSQRGAGRPARRSASEKTTSVVDLDQLFNTFDPRTRKALQRVIQGSAVQYARQGRAGQTSRPSTSTRSSPRRHSWCGSSCATRRRSSAAATRRGASVTGAVAEKRDDLASLIGNLNATTGAIASENDSLSQALGAARHAAGGQLGVRRPAFDARRPGRAGRLQLAAEDLPRFFRELRPLLNEATPTFEDLRSS